MSNEIKDKRAILYGLYADYYILLNLYLSDFPKNEKFLLVEEIRKCNNSLLDSIIELMYKHYKKTQAAHVAVNIEKLKLYFYIAHKMQCFRKLDTHINNERYLKISKKITDLKNLASSWL